MANCSNQCDNWPELPQVATHNSSTPSILSRTHYGNTQARILHFYRAPDGTTKRRTNPKASTFADAVCNRIDENWAVVKFKRIRTYTAKLEQNDYTDKRRASCQTAKSALKAYKDYQQLFDERKNAGQYPDTAPSSDQPTGFLSLPPELRNWFYHDWLVSSAPFGFHYWYYSHGFTNPNPTYLGLIPATVRLNHQINAEVRSIFFGENRFEFDFDDGWDTLARFLTKIGTTNVSHIRYLKVRLPWQGTSRFFSVRTELAVQEVCEMLAQARNLESLELRLRCSDWVDVTPLPLDISGFKTTLKIKLTYDTFHRFPHDRKPAFVVETSRQVMDGFGKVEVIRVFETVERYAKFYGWDYEAVGDLQNQA